MAGYTFLLFVYLNVDHLYLPVVTHSYPTRVYSVLRSPSTAIATRSCAAFMPVPSWTPSRQGRGDEPPWTHRTAGRGAGSGPLRRLRAGMARRDVAGRPPRGRGRRRPCSQQAPAHPDDRRTRPTLRHTPPAHPPHH